MSPSGSNYSTMTRQPRSAWSLSAQSRRGFLASLSLAGIFGATNTRTTRGSGVLKFGLTPVFLTNDLELLTKLEAYLSRKTGRAVQLVQRRTYEEITTLLLSGEMTAAWTCGYPLVQHADLLALVAVPVWNGKPLYRSYIVVPPDRIAATIDDLRGDLHAFSDPNSNSGFLVTAALLAERRLRPEQFFRRTFFTYGHRNVVRAVASGLAQSGSVDGYVWEVMASIEPALTSQTKVIRRSELLGFPPIACLAAQAQSEDVVTLQDALVTMPNDADGREVLHLLRLDGFAKEPMSLFDPIAAKMRLVRSLNS